MREKEKKGKEGVTLTMCIHLGNLPRGQGSRERGRSADTTEETTKAPLVPKRRGSRPRLEIKNRIFFGPEASARSHRHPVLS